VDVRRQLNAMLLCAVIVLLSVILRVDERGSVLMPYTEDPPLPGSCVMRGVFGVDCPTCGLTRSFIALADGEFARAFAFHRLGPLLFIYVLLQVPLRAYAIVRGKAMLLELQSRYTLPLIWAFLIALVVNWVYNLLTGSALHWGN
jgi:hypothetical protein